MLGGGRAITIVVDKQSRDAGARRPLLSRHCARAPQSSLRGKSDRQRDARFPRRLSLKGFVVGVSAGPLGAALIPDTA